MSEKVDFLDEFKELNQGVKSFEFEHVVLRWILKSSMITKLSVVCRIFSRSH